MPRYNATVEFSLETQIEPEGVRFDGFMASEVSDFEDSSYFQDGPVEVYGGSLSFVIEADGEDSAEELIASEIISDGQEVEDSNGLTWIVTGFNLELEEIEEPMDLAKAVEIVTRWTTGMGDQEIPGEVKEAILFILTLLKEKFSEEV